MEEREQEDQVPKPPTLKDVVLGDRKPPKEISGTIEKLVRGATELQGWHMPEIPLPRVVDVPDSVDVSGLVDPSPRITAKSVKALEALGKKQNELNVQMAASLAGLYGEAKDSGKWMRWTLWIALATLVVSGAALGVAIVVAQR